MNASHIEAEPRSYRVEAAITHGRRGFVTKLYLHGMFCDQKYSTKKAIAERKGKEWVCK